MKLWIVLLGFNTLAVIANVVCFLLWAKWYNLACAIISTFIVALVYCFKRLYVGVK